MKCINYKNGDKLITKLEPIKTGRISTGVKASDEYGPLLVDKPSPKWVLDVDVSVIALASTTAEVADALVRPSDLNLLMRVVNDKELQRQSVVRTVLDYPLNKLVYVEATKPKERWSEGYILWAFAQAYRKVYERESRKPGTYGVWGHQLGDLAFEKLAYFGGGNFLLGIGS